jgi:tetratricopeptide (TPR) repeat protein
MLSRAYLDAEDAPAAERATLSLVELETSNYPQLFEVARLYLQRGDTNAAVNVLARATEPALAKRQEQKLLGLLNEALARDPEQIEALRLLLRIYTWQRDDDHMRVTLERLAEAAQTHNLVGEERRALEHLVRLVPFDQSYHDRLSELGDAPEGEEDEAVATWYEPPVEEHADATPDATPDATDATVFDDVIERGGNAFAMEEPSPVNVASGGGAVEFEWNSVAMPETEESKAGEAAAVTIDPNSSFADLNEDLGGTAERSHGAAARTTTFGAGDLNVGGAFDDAALAPEKGSGDGRVKVLLAQELESVDYYLAQGYSDIARDTLDMLERQYGANEEITRRRRQLAPEDDGFEMPSVAAEAVTGADSPAEFETFAQFETFAPVEDTASEDIELSGELFVAPFEEESAPTVVDAQPAAAPPPSAQAETQQPGLHPDLADMFDEFRDEVEAGEPASAGDFETHYNTGIAYREMGLVDQAVEELQAAIALAAPLDGTPRYLQCCNLLGHCFMQKNMPRPAAMWFKKGLDAPGHTEDEYQAMRYELGTAYEQMGDLERAIEIFSEVYGTDVNYRGVAAKLRDLQAIRK